MKSREQYYIILYSDVYNVNLRCQVDTKNTRCIQFLK